MKKSLVIFTLGMVLLLAFTACSGLETSSTSSPSNSTQLGIETTSKSSPASVSLITKNATDLVFTLKDFPAGWSLNKEITEDGYLSRYFIQKDIMTTILVCRVKVFSTIDEAKNEYTTKLSEIQKKYSTDNPKIGDSAYSYAENGFRCVFIKGNVIGITDMSSELYGGSLEDVVNWAKQLEKKFTE